MHVFIFTLVALCCTVFCWSVKPILADRAPLADRLNALQETLSEIQQKIVKNGESIEKSQSQLWKMHADVKQLQADGWVQQADIQTILARQASMLKTMQKYHEDRHKGPFGSCGLEPSKVSGSYLIQLERSTNPFEVYCEQSAYGGGWTVIQHRTNGSVDFFRNWAEYREGFGSTTGEHWLGLERLHKMTSLHRHELMVETRDFKGNYGYAHYDVFQIGGESEHYALKELGSYDGNAGDAGDALRYVVGQNFSTSDRDNDAWPTVNCAVDRHGAWWYKDCGPSNLNGRYQNTNEDLEAIYWSTMSDGLAYTRMLIRRRELELENRGIGMFSN
uniref:Fibrinogen C-terminal domain-containing protein n=1 Tax=Anopheles atroparvus TaxID=41427 RepID=A0AAG5DAU4_ANOAO